jgi:penicillin amidase
MRLLKKILLALVALILIVVIGGYVYMQTLRPDVSGELTLPGLSADVEVLYDAYGVPHIYAQHERDAYYALGYVHAQDRLFQMEMIRRVASGRLAEVLGPDQVKVDKLFRTLGLHEFARDHAKRHLGADTARWQQAAHAYIKGINHFIETGFTPIEFSIIGIPKQPFTDEDIYLAGGFMSFGFAEGLRIDPVLQNLYNTHGAAYFQDLAVQSPANAVRIRNHHTSTSAQANLISAIHETLNTIPIPQWLGSNGWVVSANKSTSGFPLLANDTHIGFGQPAVWYEAHIEYPGFRFYGHHIAGIPFGLLGNNDKAGWGLTMFENDDTDFYIETPNPDNALEVKFMDQWEKLTTRTEIIHVKGESDVTLEVKQSRHGPVINGVLEGVSENDAPIALAWTLLKLDNPFVEAVYKLNHATDIKDAHEAVALMTAPGLNVMYGDVHGNIAWWACARLPIRPDSVNSKLFLDGASGEDEYLGYYPFDKNPMALNPPWGYVYSSNNQPDTVDGVVYPGYYYPRARASRIVQYLEQDTKWSQADMRKMNLDVVSTEAAGIAQEFASVLASTGDASLTEVIGVLKAWNGDHQPGDIAPTIYYTMLAHVVRETMLDELGNDALESISKTSLMPSSYPMLIRNDASPWWDNVTTQETTETRATIIRNAAAHTLKILSERWGSDIKTWTWGQVHTLTHPHPLGAVKPLDKFFNVGPYVVPGGNEVLNNLMFDLDTAAYFPVVAGPALRKITDFSNIEGGETVSPTGQSGNIMSDHYDDQAEMFATGKSRPMLMKREEIEKASTSRLLLKAN